MLLLCILHICITLVIHNEEPNVLQAMAENKYPDQPDIDHFRDIQSQSMPTQHLHHYHCLSPWNIRKSSASLR